MNFANSHDSNTIAYWAPFGKITNGWNTANFALADIDGDGT